MGVFLALKSTNYFEHRANISYNGWNLSLRMAILCSLIPGGFLGSITVILSG